MTIDRFRIDVFLLFLSQALFIAMGIGISIFAGLTGAMLTSVPALATLPVFMFAFGTAIMAIPMSFLMKRWGRRRGFQVAILCGATGSLLAATAIYLRSFELFCAGTVIMGVYQAGAQFYRFAVTEVVPLHYQSRGISYVIAGGVLAALLAPFFLNSMNAFFEPVTFAGAFVGMAMLSFVALLPVAFVAFRDPRERHRSDAEGGPARPLGTVMRQPIFIAAVANACGSFVMMALMMVAAPLAIVSCGFAPGTASYVMQWHMLAMTIPAFVTGALIQKLGVVPIMLMGLALFMVGGVIALSGITLAHFGSAMVLLGVAWNFMFTGGTNLLVESYRPSERAKVQGINDALVFGGVATASLLSGAFHAWFGWEAIQYGVLSLGCLVGGVTLWYSLGTRKKPVLE